MVKKNLSASTLTVNPVPVVEIEQTPTVEKIKDVSGIKKKKSSKKVVSEVVVKEEPKIVEVVKEVVVEPPEEKKVDELLELEVDENAEVLETETKDSEVVEEKVEKKRTRRVISKESFYNDFESFVEQCDGIFETVLKGDKLSKNNKNSIIKKLKQLQNDSYKLLKIRHLRDDKKPKSENNSGFMKPIKISQDLANFLNADPNEPITRVHVTKKLCQYIKEKDLQNPADRREIIPDDKLNCLFNLKESDEKLTYYSMQKAIQAHIFKL